MKTLYTWIAILLITAASTAGETLLALAMQRIGDLGELRARVGVLACVRRVLTHPIVFAAVGFMALAFFSLLFGLSWADLSLVGPAAAALTFIADAITAKYFLQEYVDRRRWIGAVCVACGVALLVR
jgi:hypothetical protein